MLVLTLIVLLILLFIVGTYGKPIPKALPTPLLDAPQLITVIGYWECLPLRNTEYRIMDCTPAIAIDQSDGHLAVSTVNASTSPTDLPLGTKVRIRGIMVPANHVSDDRWRHFDMDGIIDAETMEVVR